MVHSFCFHKNISFKLSMNLCSLHILICLLNYKPESKKKLLWYNVHGMTMFNKTFSKLCLWNTKRDGATQLISTSNFIIVIQWLKAVALVRGGVRVNRSRKNYNLLQEQVVMSQCFHTGGLLKYIDKIVIEWQSIVFDSKYRCTSS